VRTNSLIASRTCRTSQAKAAQNSTRKTAIQGAPRRAESALGANFVIKSA
jgi:hypothetical protein